MNALEALQKELAEAKTMEAVVLIQSKLYVLKNSTKK